MIEDAGPWADWDLATGSAVDFGLAHYRRGRVCPDVVVVTYGLMRQRVEPLECGLVDLVSICPLDWETIEMAARHSGRLLIVEPDVAYGGVGAEIAAHIAEAMPHVRIKRLGAPKSTIPAAPSLHHLTLPSVEEITRAIADFTR